MRIAAHLFSYPPHRQLGAERMTSILLERLAAKHEVRVATVVDVRDYVRNGVHVSGRLVDILASPEDRCDVFITHADLLEYNYDRAKGLGASVVAIVHNVREDTLRQVSGYRPDLVVANSPRTSRILADLGVDSIVLRPPTVKHEAPVPMTRSAVTLVNLSPDKGGHILAGLARRMPHQKFLGVVGGYDEQLIDQPDNVTIIGQTDAMWMVYGLTKLLIMPSAHETWGMVGCEALALGIPVVASDLEALHESLDDGALYAPAGDGDAWEAQVRSALGSIEARRFAAYTRGDELLAQTETDLAKWVDIVEGLL